MNPAETLEPAEQLRVLRGLGPTIRPIEHKPDVSTQRADTAVVIERGDRIAEGCPAEVRRNKEVLRAYLGHAATEKAARETALAATDAA